MRWVPALLALLIATACGGASRSSSTATTASSARTTMHVSSDFAPGAAIARVHTCDGRDMSLPLHVTGLPAGTREIVVVMVDPDAPGGTFTHWGIAQLDPAGATISLVAGVTPTGAVLARNSFGSLGYRGPCPPAGPAHHYHITVYALSQPSGLSQGFSADALAGLPVIAQGSLIGTYARR